MGIVRQLVTQTGNDTRTDVAVDTGLTSDGKSGWRLTSVQAFWTNGQSAPAADWYVNAFVQSDTGLFSAADEEVMSQTSWGLQNTAGVAVAVPFEPVKDGLIIGSERVTVQPTIYLSVSSAATGQANTVIMVVEYEIVKLTDLEVLSLLYGGA